MIPMSNGLLDWTTINLNNNSNNNIININDDDCGGAVVCRLPVVHIVMRSIQYSDRLGLRGSIVSCNAEHETIHFCPHDDALVFSDRAELVQQLFTMINAAFLQDDQFFITAPRLAQLREVEELMQSGTFIVGYTSEQQAERRYTVVCASYLKQQYSIEHPEHATHASQSAQHAEHHKHDTTSDSTSQRHRMYLGLMAVHPEYKRQGLAGLLVEMAEHVARQAHCASLEIYVVSIKDWIHRFYRRYGFEFSGITTPFSDIERPYLLIDAHLIHMSKSLL
jgi:GNAT superfamily N-acetyltransferase